MSDFDGSWTTYDVGILDRISEQVRRAAFVSVVNQADLTLLSDVRGTGVPRPERQQPAPADRQPLDAADDRERRARRVPQQPRVLEQCSVIHEKL